MKMLMFKFANKKISLIVLLTVCLITGCNYSASQMKKDLLFDTWYDENFSSDYSKNISSVSGKFSAELLWEEPDFSDKIILTLSSIGNDEKIIVGRSTRGIKFNWTETQIGDVLSIEHNADTHFTESFVIYPWLTQKKEIRYLILYKTPDFNLYYGKIPPEHIYSRIKEISFDGVMTISLNWDFANANTGGNAVILKIPLFYGLSGEKSE